MRSRSLDAGRSVLILERGEALHDAILAFCTESGIAGAWVSGLGAICEVDIGAYVLETRTYTHTLLDGDVELCNLTANVARGPDGALFLHAHVTVSDEECRTHGGHLHRAVVAVTAEFLVVDLGAGLDRRPDDSVGLNLLCP